MIIDRFLLVSLVVVMAFMLTLTHILLILHHLVEGLIRVIHLTCVGQLLLNYVLDD